MFDFSFGKLAIIFALCLIVLGPEKLPKLAQQLGRLAGQARAMARHFRTQLEQELATEELAKQKRELEAEVRSSVAAVTDVGKAVEQTKDAMVDVIEPAIDPGSANNSGHGEFNPDAPAADAEPAVATVAAPPRVADDAKPHV